MPHCIETLGKMGIHLLSIKPVWHCGLQQHQDSSWRLAAFSLCIVLIIQQSVTLSLPSPTLSVAVAESSLALISLPHLNDGGDAASSPLSSASKLVVKRETTVLTPGQTVINAVPEEDRANFFTYQLAVGLQATQYMRQKSQWLRNLKDVIEYVEEEAPQLKDVPTYENFPSDLLQWLMATFELLPVDVYNQLRSRSTLLCTSKGVCYTHNDVVCFCCPF